MLEVDKALGYFRAKVSTRISTLFCIDGKPLFAKNCKVRRGAFKAKNFTSRDKPHSV